MKNLRPAIRLTLVSIMLLIGAVAILWLWHSGKGAPQTVPNPSGPITTEHSPSPAPEPLPAISPEMAAAIRQMSNHSTEGLKETVNADGSITLHHEDRFQSVMVGVKGPDGKVHIGHGEDFLQNVKDE